MTTSDDNVAALLALLRGTHLTIDRLKWHLDDVLGGDGSAVTFYPRDNVVLRIAIVETAWGPLSQPRSTVVSSRTLWFAVAERLGYPDDEIDVAQELWDEAELDRQARALPEALLDARWFVRGLRAYCVTHCSDRCEACPAPSGFRRSYGIWVAPHPYWPGPRRSVWRVDENNPGVSALDA